MTNSSASNLANPEDIFSETTANFVKALAKDNYAEADKLLGAGAEINAIGESEISPLLWAMGRMLSKEQIAYLLDKGANPNWRQNKKAFSAIYFAAGGDRPEILGLLLQYKGDPNLLGPLDQTPLMTAISQGRDQNIQLLLEYGADINQLNKHGQTAANIAVVYGRFDLVALFLEQGLSRNLSHLAKDVQARSLPVGSSQQPWKDKVVAILKKQGIKPSEVAPCYPPGDSRRTKDDCMPRTKKQL